MAADSHPISAYQRQAGPPGASPQPAGEAPLPGAILLIPLALLLVVGPLLLVALALVVDANVSQQVERYERRIVYSVLLDPRLEAAQAASLAEAWRAERVWFEATVMAPAETFASLDELRDWVSERENAILVDMLPYSVELRPLRLLSEDREHRALARNLAATEGVDRVFYDREGLEDWLERLDFWRQLRALLLGLGGALALSGALLGGWLLEILRLGTQHVRSHAVAPLSRQAPALLCLGAAGALTLLPAWGIQSLLAALSPFPLVFMQAPAALGLVVGGGLLGLLSLFLGDLLPSRRRRAVVGLLLFALAAPAGPALAQPALPPARVQGLEDAPAALSAPTAAERRALRREIARRLEELDDLIQRLMESLRQNQSERRQNLENMRTNRRKLDDLLGRRELLRDSIRRRERDIRATGQALIPLGRLRDQGNLRTQLRRDQAFVLLTRSAEESFATLSLDRQRLGALDPQIEDLRREAALLRYFENLGEDDSPERIRSEIARLETERNALERRLRLLDAPPPPAPEPTPPPPGQSNPAPLPSHLVSPGDEGVFFFGEPGTLVRALRGGKVLHAGPFSGYGNMVFISHDDGLGTGYAFLEEVSVDKYERVEAGQYVGSVGLLRRFSRGGFRFELRRDNKLAPLDTLDPPLSLRELEERLLGP